MPLPSECAFDTESGICPDGEIRNVLIQYCSSTAHSPEEVFLLCGEDCYDRFLLEWEATGWDVDMYFYNSKWEGRTFIESLITCGYQYCVKRKLPPSSWYAIEDPMKIYRITVTNARGYTLTICDDLLHTVCRMEKAADLVRRRSRDGLRVSGSSPNYTSTRDCITYGTHSPRMIRTGSCSWSTRRWTPSPRR